MVLWYDLPHITYCHILYTYSSYSYDMLFVSSLGWWRWVSRITELEQGHLMVPQCTKKPMDWLSFSHLVGSRCDRFREGELLRFGFQGSNGFQAMWWKKRPARCVWERFATNHPCNLRHVEPFCKPQTSLDEVIGIWKKCSFSCNNRFLLRSHTKKESFPTWSRAPESEDKTRRTNRVELGQLASTLTFSEPPHPALGAPWCSWHLCVLLGCYSTSALVGYPPPSQNHTLRTNACRTLVEEAPRKETQRHDLTIQQPNENLSTSEHG